MFFSYVSVLVGLFGFSRFSELFAVFGACLVFRVFDFLSALFRLFDFFCVFEHVCTSSSGSAFRFFLSSSNGPYFSASSMFSAFHTKAPSLASGSPRVELGAGVTRVPCAVVPGIRWRMRRGKPRGRPGVGVKM